MTGVGVDLHRRLRERGHDVPLRLPDGHELGPVDAGYRLVLRHPWSLRSLLLPPTDLAAGDAYVRDDIDVEGSMVAALTAVAALRQLDFGRLELAQTARDLLRLPRPPRRRRRRARLTGRRHSTARDAHAARFHYDVGNDFYRLFLDRQLVYSCAYFSDDPPAAASSAPGAGDHPPGTADDDLDRAQARKLDLVCRKLDLRPGERFLDIGCGWGALVVHAARHYGVHALGVTLSPEQARLARRRAAEAGLSQRVDIRVQDYRDVRGQFDAVASVGMFEHVGSDQLAHYFGTVRRLTAVGGRFLNHGITTGRRDTVRDLARVRDSFVGAYVFPDGTLVPAHTAVRLMEQAGFELLDVEQLRRHYARTLTLWVQRLERSADAARRLVGDATYRVWRAYMAGSVVGFTSGDLGVVQVLGGVDAALPLTRRRMLDLDAGDLPVASPPQFTRDRSPRPRRRVATTS